MLTFDLVVLELLETCGCPIKIISKFAGLTIEKLNKYTLQDFVGLLGPDEEDNARKIYEQVQRSKGGNEEQESVDDDVKIIEVIVRDNFQPTAKEQVIHDAEEGQTGQANPVEEEEIHNFPGDNNDCPQSSELDNYIKAIEDSRAKEVTIVLDPLKHEEGFARLMANEKCRVEILSDKSSSQNYGTKSPTAVTRQILEEWDEGLMKWGSKITNLEMSTWTWQESNFPCPYNLIKILPLCPSLKRLSLSLKFPSFCDIALPPPSAQFPAGFKLPELEALTILEGYMEHPGECLRQIIVAAVKLERLFYEIGNFIEVTSFLPLLQSFEGTELQTLRILSIRTKEEDGYLTQEQLQMISNIKAPSLEWLELGNGLWEDVEGLTIQKILSNFPILKRFSVHGTFKGSSKKLPKIQIVLPPMTNLESIAFGADYAYTTTGTNSSRSEGPPVKMRKGSRGERINLITFSVRSFPLTLKFPALFPRLKEIYLGNVFQLEEFHFSNFPQLTSFCVGSRWDLSVIFPPLNSRHVSYPLITRLQIPDCLTDPSFVKLIPTRFPNLVECQITLATVKVLRTFFSVMADSKLEKLTLSTQFYFASSLESCILDKPTEVIQKKAELEKVRKLKEYKYWEEFVQYHNIQLPMEDLSSLEGEGLKALKNLKYILFDHQERVLKIPKGDLHWDSPDCKYTRYLIGFERYPWSRKCEKLRNYLVENRPGFDDLYLEYDVKFREAKEPEDLIYTAYVTQQIRKENVKSEMSDCVKFVIRISE